MSDPRTFKPRPRRSPPWAKLSRRRFLGGVLSAAGVAGAIAVARAAERPGVGQPAQPEAPPFTPRTRWIGHG